MALSVRLYRVVGKGKDRRYIPIELGRRGRRSKEEFTGPFYLRYGAKYEHVGMDFKAAVEAMQRRQATLDAVCGGVTVKTGRRSQSQAGQGRDQEVPCKEIPPKRLQNR
jgi:hypothetical protein